ncbi:MAG: hypothetical protein ACR2RV_00605, partial [Verrucomicrobiales bacterium]
MKSSQASETTLPAGGRGGVVDDSSQRVSVGRRGVMFGVGLAAGITVLVCARAFSGAGSEVLPEPSSRVLVVDSVVAKLESTYEAED